MMDNVMNIIKSLAIAFSSYSRIPMPQFEWTEENMKYVMAFFPFIGVVIGGLEVLWYLLSKAAAIPAFAYCIVSALLPVLVTGGFHVDGYMDTSDAICSRTDRKRKLEILKDSHVGAFAIIRLMTAAGLYVAAISFFRTFGAVLVFSLTFIISRSLSALAVLHFRSATHQGSLFYIASASSRKINTIAVCIWFLAAAAGMILSDWKSGLFAASAAVGSFVYYRWMSYRQFGGITGDLAGYFVVFSEVAMAAGTAVGALL